MFFTNLREAMNSLLIVLSYEKILHEFIKFKCIEMILEHCLKLLLLLVLL
jgi:hypothetical protein